jgi:hypothetical protein
MRKEQLFRAVAIGSLVLTGCEVFSPKGSTPIEDLVQPQTSTLEPETQETFPKPETQETSLPFTITISPTSTLEIDKGYLTGALICPVESRELELPEVGEVVEFQGMDWKIVGVDEFNSDRCENGIQIVLQLCPCEEETPTATATYFESSPTPTKEKKTPFPPTPTPSPRPPTETPKPTPEPTPTPKPTATIPPTITPQPPEPTSTASS